MFGWGPRLVVRAIGVIIMLLGFFSYTGLNDVTFAVILNIIGIILIMIS